MKKYEYYSFYGTHGDETDRQLDNLGELGWMAYAIVPYESGIVVYLRREKP